MRHLKKLFAAASGIFLFASTIFAATTNSVSAELVYQFPQYAGWISDLVQARDGNLYGTTSGEQGWGTIFRLTPDGQVSTVAVFDYETTGANPTAGMILGHDGSLYGTTCYGRNGATVFKFQPDRGQAGLSALCSLPSLPTEFLYGSVFSLAEGKNHAFYGTVMSDSEYHWGFAFEVTMHGNLTIFTNFNFANGGFPLVGLTRGPGRALFGTTMSGGGPNGYGTVFKMDLDGTVTPISVFDGNTNGAGAGGLCSGRKGDFYGTTRIGGPDNSGTIFHITRKGEMKTVVSFQNTLGKNPMTPLMRCFDGNFYGTTYYGGTNNGGTAFRMTPQGKLTELFSFGSETGVHPSTTLIQANDGYFYGTTAETATPGTIFRFQGMDPRTFQAWSRIHGHAQTR